MAPKKQQNELLALVALVAVAAVVWYVYFGHHKVSGVLSATGKYQPIDAVDYQTVFDGLKAAQSAEYKPSGRNIFVAGLSPVTPTATTADTKPVKPPFQPAGPQLPPPPPKPVLPWKFFGYGTLPTNGPRRAFFLDGDEVHIVGEGDTVLNTIRITHIGNDRIEYEDINTGMKNSSAMEMAPPA
jgi:hypothetical protein